MKYVIHTYPKRLWYVTQYLVPSMERQGIKPSDILILNDNNGYGNLQAFIHSLDYLDEDCWHLQDDILISKEFKKKTEVLGRINTVVNGFCHYDFNEGCILHKGFAKTKFMYLSFPCIFIPKDIADSFYKWALKQETKKKYKEIFDSGKQDDKLFYEYMQTQDYEIYNCYDCLVDHVDYLIGGSSINPRDHQVRAMYWNENELNIELEERLKKEGKINVKD